jgi:hypothetical protein
VSGGWFEGDSVAESLESSDVGSRRALGAEAGVVEVRAEIDETRVGVVE